MKAWDWSERLLLEWPGNEELRFTGLTAAARRDHLGLARRTVPFLLRIRVVGPVAVGVGIGEAQPPVHRSQLIDGR